MKKILLGLFLMLSFFFIINQNQTFAQVEQAEDIAEQVAGKIENVVTKTDKEKAEEALTANIEELKKIQQSRPNCGDIGKRCCTKKDAPQIPNGSIGKDIKVSSIDNPQVILDTGSQTSQKEIDDLMAQAPCNIGGIAVVDKNNLDECMCQNEIRNLKTLCGGIENPIEREKSCRISCNGVWTALGCVDYELKGFVQNTLLGWGIGLAGMIAMLCIIYSAFVLQTSSGNPEKIKKAKERLTACIVGLLLIIFSVFILKLIGVDILQIPGFGI